ncbi:MAG: hypothetical protein C0599_07510 [Salinivirgaceae bacterium]|nr:MAG: hypothetical protein C0599_07510 [Salinivirgaceae bacterium]
MSESKENIKPQAPKWLEDVQNNSWSPEILISGLTITFIFVMDDAIFNFFASLIQDYGAKIISYSGFVTFIVALNFIKLTLIIHLILRGLWTGLVGLSYVFPNGVNEKKLPKVVGDVKFDKPVSMVLKVENICSLLFSFIYFFISLVLIGIVFYVPLVLIELFGQENILLFLMIYLVLFFVPIIVLSLFKKSKLKAKLNKNIANNIYYTISTNTGKGLAMLFFIISVLVAIPISMSDIREFSSYYNPPQEQSETDFRYTKDCENYNDERNNNLRVKRATIESYIVDEKIELFISYYKVDEWILRKAKERKEEFYELTEDPLQKEIIIPMLYKVYIDSTPINDLEWVLTRHKHTNQKGMYVLIDDLNIPKGLHRIIINSVYFSRRADELKMMSPWEEILFYKN